MKLQTIELPIKLAEMITEERVKRKMYRAFGSSYCSIAFSAVILVPFVVVLVNNDISVLLHALDNS